MEHKPIKNEKEYEETLEWINGQLDDKPHPDSPAGNRLQAALLLIKAYEDARYQVPPPDPLRSY